MSAFGRATARLRAWLDAAEDLFDCGELDRELAGLDARREGAGGDAGGKGGAEGRAFRDNAHDRRPRGTASKAVRRELPHSSGGAPRAARHPAPLLLLWTHWL